jgi:acylphosphatase
VGFVIRRTYIVHGHVQGVGFRATAREIAERHPVTGYVKNLPDGTVELVMEGEPREMEKAAEDIRNVMRRWVTRFLFGESPATGEFQGFEIRY